MLEKHLSQYFVNIFKDYQIWTPRDREAGWPDRGVQIGSRIVWFELKVIDFDYINMQMKIYELSASQAAWLAKWQRAGGYCFLFLGFTDEQQRFYKYGILRCSLWHLWLKVPHQPIEIKQLVLFTADEQEIQQWFRETFQPQGVKLQRKM